MNLGCGGNIMLCQKKCHYVLVDYCIFLLSGFRDGTNNNSNNHKTHSLNNVCLLFTLWHSHSLNFRRLKKSKRARWVKQHAATHLFGCQHYGFATEIRAATDLPDSCSQPPASNDPAVHISTPVATACDLQLITKLMSLLRRDWKPVMFDFYDKSEYWDPTLAQIPSCPLNESLISPKLIFSKADKGYLCQNRARRVLPHIALITKGLLMQRCSVWPVAFRWSHTINLRSVFLAALFYQQWHRHEPCE